MGKKTKPHIVYGAQVYRTRRDGHVTPENTWTCSLVQSPAQRSSLGSPAWAFGLPGATGPTPAAACEAFDRLWESGDLPVPELDDEQHDYLVDLAVRLYKETSITQGDGALIARLSRSGFIDVLLKRSVSPIQVDTDVVLKRSMAQESIINEVMEMRDHHTQQNSVVDLLAFITLQARRFSNARRAPGWKEAERRHLVSIAALAMEGLELMDREEGDS